MKSYDIVGYTYKADIYCTDWDCIVMEVLKDMGIEGHGLSTDTEDALERLATTSGIDRMDERTYDSGDFPKVVFADMLDGSEYCGSCHCQLMEG